jgi:diguanylate cyclase
MRILESGSFFRRLIVACALPWLLAPMGIAAATPTAHVVMLNDSADSAIVGNGVELLFERPGEHLSAQQAAADTQRWTRHDGKGVNMGRRDSAIWVRFQVDNRSSENNWLLSVDWPPLHHVSFHVLDPAQDRWEPPVQAGVAHPMEHPAVKDPMYVFPLHAATGESRVVLLRVETVGPYIVPLTLWRAKALQAHQHDLVLWMGLLLGVLGAMLLYNLCIALISQDSTYWYYTAFVSAVLLYELTVMGFGGLLLWGEVEWVRVRAHELFTSLTFLTSTLFLRRFLRLKTNALPHVRRLSTFLIWVWVMTAALAAWDASLPVIFYLLAVGGMFNMMATLYCSVSQVIRGDIAARYYLVAWTPLLVGTIARLVSVLGLIGASTLLVNAQHVGFALQLLVLSLAMADSLRRARLMKQRALQNELTLTRKLEAERASSLLAQQRANQELEQRVLARTAELKQANAVLATLSVTDALTNLHNRRSFDATLQFELERAARTGKPVSLILADIDRFKAINDQLGHLTGDECLKHVAQALRAAAARSTDMVARYGGEEFAIVLADTDLAHAATIAERARQEVEAIHFRSRGNDVQLCISLGVVSFNGSSSGNMSDLIARADTALYTAKREGRNRVILAE